MLGEERRRHAVARRGQIFRDEPAHAQSGEPLGAMMEHPGLEMAAENAAAQKEAVEEGDVRARSGARDREADDAVIAEAVAQPDEKGDGLRLGGEGEQSRRLVADAAQVELARLGAKLGRARDARGRDGKRLGRERDRAQEAALVELAAELALEAGVRLVEPRPLAILLGQLEGGEVRARGKGGRPIGHLRRAFGHPEIGQQGA